MTPSSGEPRLEARHRARHQAVRVPGLFGALGLQIAASITGNSAIAGTPSFTACFRDTQQQVDADALDAGHGGHGLAARRSIQHEHRIDQVIRGQTMLAHQAARKIVAAHATHPCSRE
jgi:hypothetical protein